MKPLEKYVSNLALRTSYGTTGNQQVSGGFYAARGLYSYGNNYRGANGAVPTGIDNPNLAWESKGKFNIGLDVLLFDILGIEFDYYNELTTDMIFSVPVSRTSGFSSRSMNIGEMRNKGVELMVNALLVNNKNLRWTASFNITRNRNVIEKLATDEPIIGTTTIREVGRDYNTWYLPVWAGVDPTNGREWWYRNAESDEKVYSIGQAGFQTIGSASPDFYGGFSTRLESNGFDLSIAFSYSKGGWVLNDDPYLFEHNGARGFISTTNYNYENSWRPDRTDGKTPRFIYNNPAGNPARSTRFLQPADFLKVQAITLGYTIPRNLAQRMHVSGARIYTSFENPFLWFSKDFRGFTPETGMDGTNMFNYPQARMFSCGLSITL
jgi:hypothetical protein